MWSKILNLATPYKRTFIIFKIDEETYFTLPGINKALILLEKGDSIYIQNLEEIEKFCLFDYQLIDDKKTNFNSEYLNLKNFLKKGLTINKDTTFTLSNKVVYNNSITFNFQLQK